MQISVWKFEFTRKGAGPILIFQHGFLRGAEYWRNLIDYFSAYFEVIAPTLPGSGYHLHSGSTAIDRIEGYVDYLIALMGPLGVQRFHLLGHSMSGTLHSQRHCNLASVSTSLCCRVPARMV